MKRHEISAGRFARLRTVDVWLPPGYQEDVAERFPVLFMHDGQNLFDAAVAFAGVDWGVAEAMTRLIGCGEIRRAVVVGIWNSGEQRVLEYMPEKAVRGDAFRTGTVDSHTIRREQLKSDAYLRFIASELKPFIDATYRTLPDQQDTFIIGSSMGGLISAYAVAEYPDVFSGAGCMSTHWPADGGSLIDYLKRNLPAAVSHRFYFDFGTDGLDDAYEPYQRKMDRVMEAAGYVHGENWITRKFPGAEHSELAWRKRVEVPLRFLLEPN